MRRVEEVRLILGGDDPYSDPDATYPPTSYAVFLPLIAPFPAGLTRVLWLVLNLGALAVVGGRVGRSWGQDWPLELRMSFLL